ncbi:MAG: toll/interleukin-1 receptor domain-containing protein, partial [bacterium]|nr:toll/interleukin-1 receptor domain-containing protein [bacterium]
MLFERDIFISYAHIDNEPLKEGDKGWVAAFHRALEVRLAQLIGEKPQIWRDQKLQGNDFFGDEIVQQFPKTAIMISILSPRYIKSEWCTKEVKEFWKTAESSVGTKIGNKSRIFKLIKTAVPYEAHPREIADTLGYEFYITDPETGRTKELDQKISGELEQVYWGRLDDIAHDICDLLEKVKQTGATGAQHQEEQLTVYLAEAGYELKEQRDMIKRELLEAGYRVLPETRLPPVASEYTKSVAELLDQCVLSVHMLGGSYGPVPEGAQKSIPVLQNELAAQKSKTGKLERLIWLLADGVKTSEDERQNQFVHLIRTDVDSQYGADLFETSIEDFKYAIHDKLKSIEAAAAKTAVTPAPNGAAPREGRGNVFLAETNYALKEKRENIKHRLIEQGYTVLPTQPLPLYYSELTEAVDNDMAQCQISIHMLGEDYGMVPDGTEKSSISLQYEKAAAKSRNGQLQRLVRVSPSINRDDERQRLFIDSVKTNTAF